MSARVGERVLVTGGAGFIGCNLVDRLATDGQRVTILDNFSRAGAERNAAWLKQRHGEALNIIRADIRDPAAIEAATSQADAVFHFAAQVAVTASLVDPHYDFSVNVGGTLNLLEALRRKGANTPMIFASTNKVYGDLADIPVKRSAEGYCPEQESVLRKGISERRPLSFCTPYGCSKGAADQYVLDYAHSFGLPTAVMRMSCIYGPHQMGTEDQGWVAHFLIKALRGEPITVFGDGWQVRDVLYVDDAVDAYLATWRRIAQVKGQAFNIGGGVENALSLNTLLAFASERLERRMLVNWEDWRAGDQRYFVSDTSRVRTELCLPDPLPWCDGVLRLLDWLRLNLDSPAVEMRPEAAE